jgi:hypothetical protein
MISSWSGGKHAQHPASAIISFTSQSLIGWKSCTAILSESLLKIVGHNQNTLHLP